MKKLKKEAGEITVILTIATLLIMASTALVSSLVLKNKKTTTTKAATKTECVPEDGGDYAWGPSDICYDISQGEGSYQACPADAQSRAACCLAKPMSSRLCCGSASTINGESIFDYLNYDQCTALEEGLIAYGGSCSHECIDETEAPTSTPVPGGQTPIGGYVVCDDSENKTTCSSFINMRLINMCLDKNRPLNEGKVFYVNLDKGYYGSVNSNGSCGQKFVDPRKQALYINNQDNLFFEPSFKSWLIGDSAGGGFCCGPYQSTKIPINTPTPLVGGSNCANQYQKNCADFTSFCEGGKKANSNVFYTKISNITDYSQLQSSSFLWNSEAEKCEQLTDWRKHCCVPLVPSNTPTPTVTLTPTPIPTLSPNLKVETQNYTSAGDLQWDKNNKDDPFCRNIFLKAIDEMAQKGVIIDNSVKTDLENEARDAVCRHTNDTWDYGGTHSNRKDTHIVCNKSRPGVLKVNESKEEYCFVKQDVFENYQKNKTIPFPTLNGTTYTKGRYISSNSCSECNPDTEMCLQFNTGLSIVATYCVPN